MAAKIRKKNMSFLTKQMVSRIFYLYLSPYILLLLLFISYDITISMVTSVICRYNQEIDCM